MTATTSLASTARSIAVPLLALALLGGGLAACSGDDDAPTAGATGGTSSGGGTAADDVPSPPESTATPSAAVSPRSAVRIGQAAPLAADVTVRITGTRRITLDAKGPGEIDGPGARVAVRVANTSTKDVDLGALAVNAYYGKAKKPASPSSFNSDAALAGALKPGAAKTGLYYFRVPSAQFGSLQVEVSSGESPYVLRFLSR